MAGQRTLPGLGLSAFWTVGSNDWDQQHDPDTRKISVLCQLRAKSRTTALPGSPTNGDIYIVPSGAGSNPNEIAARDNGAWVYYVPSEGFLAWVEDDDEFVYYDGSAWQVLETGGGGSSAPTVRDFTGTTDTAVLADANNIITGANAGAITATIPPNGDVAFPVGTTLTYVQKGAGQITLAPGSGVTLNKSTGLNAATAAQWAVVSAVQISANVWVLTGHLEVAA